MRKQFYQPMFCNDSAPTLEGLHWLWGFANPEERKKAGPGAKKAPAGKRQAGNRRGKRELNDAESSEEEEEE